MNRSIKKSIYPPGNKAEGGKKQTSKPPEKRATPESEKYGPVKDQEAIRKSK